MKKMDCKTMKRSNTECRTTKRSVLNKKGFSISELLIVVLVLSLITVIMGGGIVVVKNAYTRITLKAEAQTLLATTVTEITDEFRFARDVNLYPLRGSDAVTFVSANKGCPICFDNDDDRGIIIRNPINQDTADLLSDKTLSSGMVNEIRDITYDDSGGIFTATVIVKDSSGKEIVSQGIKVKVINAGSGE